MTNLPKTWGVSYQHGNPDVPHSWDYECLECKWSYFSAESFDQIVGFHLLSEPEYGITTSYKKIGIFIIECPKCFSKFWIHATEDIMEYAIHGCQKWPKENPE